MISRDCLGEKYTRGAFENLLPIDQKYKVHNRSWRRQAYLRLGVNLAQGAVSRPATGVKKQAIDINTRDFM